MCTFDSGSFNDLINKNEIFLRRAYVAYIKLNNTIKSYYSFFKSVPRKNRIFNL